MKWREGSDVMFNFSATLVERFSPGKPLSAGWFAEKRNRVPRPPLDDCRTPSTALEISDRSRRSEPVDAAHTR